ncbi:hypothetical protein [Sporisorium scitamineum]|nr:hypothetical protein [Sporisorium scitamineum]
MASPKAAESNSTTPVQSEVQPANSSASTTLASDKPLTNADNHAQKQPSEAITGLTPEQVLQELKNNGYVDQLRRQMFDAFTASSSTTVRSAAPSISTTATDVQVVAPASQAAPSASTASAPTVSTTSTATDAAPSTPALSITPASTSTNPPPLDIGTKPSFLNFLSTPLRQQVEKEHGNLRDADTRGQQDLLLKLLESANVDHPHRDALGDATLYDLLVRHIVMADPVSGVSGTAGILDKQQGRVGKEAMAKITETINEMLHPSAKDAEDEDEDDDEDEEDDAEQAQVTDDADKPTPSYAPTTAAEAQP